MDYSAKSRLFARLARKAMFILRPLKNYYSKYQAMSVRKSYHAWAVHNENECFVDDSVSEKNLVSIVVPAYNTDHNHLLEMVYSVINQHYQNWEMILVNASSDMKRHEKIEACSSIDSRIKVINLEKNFGISENTNEGIIAAQGDFIAFLDHDDKLHNCALHSMVAKALESDADLIYSDEDKITHDGYYFFGPHCKPDWSPQLFENVNYINHFTLIRTKYVKGVDGLRASFDGAQDYDLLLRVIDEYSPKIEHVDKVLYHWRAAETSTAKNISNKQYIFEAGRSALQEHFERIGVKATVEIINGKPGFYKAVYSATDYSLIVGPVNRMQEPIAALCVKKLLKSNNGIKKLIIGEWYKKYSPDNESSISFVPQGPNFYEHAIKHITTNTVVFVSEAIESDEKHQLDDIAAVALATGSIVQPVITDIKGMIRDAGLVDSPHGLQPLFKGIYFGQGTFFGNTDWVRNISRISYSVFAITTKTLKKHGVGADLYRKEPQLLWSHSKIKFISKLTDEVHLKTFNSQLSNPMFEIRMASAALKVEMERSDD